MEAVCRLDSLMQVQLIGKDRLVLDLSCRWRDGSYWIVTDRWQCFTEVSQDSLQPACPAASLEKLYPAAASIFKLRAQP